MDLYNCPALPVEITVDNWNKNTYYFQTIYQKWLDPYQAVKQGFTGDEYLRSLGYKTWKIILDEISEYIVNQGGFDKLPQEMLNSIYTGIMINIEYLRINKTVEQKILVNMQIGQNSLSSTPMQIINSKEFIGEDTWDHFIGLGIVRTGIYGYDINSGWATR